MDRPEPPFPTQPLREEVKDSRIKKCLRRREGRKVLQFLSFLTIQIYFNLQYIKFMLPKFSLFCYDGNRGRFPCPDLQAFLSYFISLSCLVWGVRKFLCGCLAARQS